MKIEYINKETYINDKGTFKANSALIKVDGDGLHITMFNKDGTAIYHVLKWGFLEDVNITIKE